ncbi:ABC transporter permease [Nocardioides sp. 1609]|uniref:ABC transporter permease n=1 Tax=Nocardioides sp. 1609 TaxID=2508327 RepID=UPI001FD64835|nr:ABC transporter permease [Nocardioides sp. 1609]
MADTRTAARDPHAGIVMEAEPETGAKQGRRIDRETVLMLTVPPALVLIAFAAFVVWRQSAEFNETELRQLAWTEIRSLLWQHVKLTVTSSVLVVLIAVPLGIALTRSGLRKFSPFVVGFANIGQGAPSIGLIVLLAIWLGYGFWTSVLALTLYGLLPVLRNTIVGLDGVDPTLVEAGRGLGMSAGLVLLRVELPLALSVIMAGVRTSLVLVVGTATLATFINGGGLGAIIQTGISLFLPKLIVAGALLVALLALFVEWLGRVLEFLARPKGV